MTSCTRRGFLAVSAAAAAPLILPTGVLGRSGRRGANDKIVLGVIGQGDMGGRLMRPMTTELNEPVAALCDVDQERLEEGAAWVESELGYEVECYADYRRLLDRQDIDAVVIATPDHWHAVQAVHAAEAGKDIYVEKPLNRTIAEGRAIIDAVRRHKRVAQVGAMGRSLPGVQQIATYIRNGELGEVHRVDCWRGANPVGDNTPDEPPPDHLDWDMYLGPARWRPYNPEIVHYNFRYIMDLGGGQIRDLGAHLFSQILWYLDRDSDGPVRISATGKPPAQGVFDNPVELDVTWEFTDPELTITWKQPGERDGDGAVYHGERETLEVGGMTGRSPSTEDHVMEYEPPSDGLDLREPSEYRGDLPHYENWFHCIRTREEPNVSVEAGHRVASLCILGNIAYLLGRSLEYDPAAERFVDDEEANRMLNSPGRGPWHV